MITKKYWIDYCWDRIKTPVQKDKLRDILANEDVVLELQSLSKEDLLKIALNGYKGLYQKNRTEIFETIWDQYGFAGGGEEYATESVKLAKQLIDRVIRECAKEEIIEMVEKIEGLFYYSDIAEKLNLDLKLVVDTCVELFNKTKK